MRYITAQPDIDYYVWQLKVQMYNFRKLGIEKDAIIVFGFTGEPNPNAMKFAEQTRAWVIFIPDERTGQDRQYISTIRPHLLKQFFHRYTVKEFMYLDNDVIFTGQADFKAAENILVSDCQFYLNSQYIRSKGDNLLTEMCEIVGVDRQVVIDHDKACGGAQYIFNFSPDYAFWHKVERDSLDLFNHMTGTENIYHPQHPIQSWTADMWALLWNLWKTGHETEISPELTFSWGTDKIDAWDRNKIFHNAGVTDERKNELFYKADYRNSMPFGVDLSYVNDTFCSRKYADLIDETFAHW